MKNWYSPNDFLTGSDSERIQAAIDAAETTGVGEVHIPRWNDISGGQLWIIDRTILLPSDITVVLENSHLRMADGVMCQMFCNRNAYTELGNTPEGEQHNIRICGTGNALLDGGNENGLNEFTSGRGGNPSVYRNLLIYLHNVSGFEIDHFTIRDQRWWAMAFVFADNGRISNLHFELTQIDTNACWRNQDGIDLRIGCHNILIENISGETGDDCIALTALTPKNSSILQELVQGKNTYIHDVIIQNIRCFSHMCAIIRLLSQQGNKIYNVAINNIFDISTPRKTSKVQMALRIGEDSYYKSPEERGNAGDIANVTVNNLYTRAITAVHIEMAVKNLHVSNIFLQQDGHHAVTVGGFALRSPIFMFVPERWDEQRNKILFDRGPDHGVLAENILIEHVYCTAKTAADHYDPALFMFSSAKMKNVVIRDIHCDDDREMTEFFHENTLSELHIEP